MLSFYMDHHVHRAITEGLRRRGIDVLTAFEDGTDEQDDELLLERATALGRIIVSQDHDFLRIASEWQRTSREFPGVVYAIQERIDIGQTIEYLELIAYLKEPDEIRNRVEYIPLR